MFQNKLLKNGISSDDISGSFTVLFVCGQPSAPVIFYWL